MNDLLRQVLGGDPPALADRLLGDLRRALGRVPTSLEVFSLARALGDVASLVSGSPPPAVEPEPPCERCVLDAPCVRHDVLIHEGRDG